MGSPPPCPLSSAHPLKFTDITTDKTNSEGAPNLWENRAWNCDFCPAKALVGIIAFITEAESKQGQNLLPGVRQVVLLDLAT